MDVDALLRQNRRALRNIARGVGPDADAPLPGAASSASKPPPAPAPARRGPPAPPCAWEQPQVPQARQVPQAPQAPQPASALPPAKLESIKSRMKQHKASGAIAAPTVRLVPAPAPGSAAPSIFDLEDDDWLSEAGAQFSPPDRSSSATLALAAEDILSPLPPPASPVASPRGPSRTSSADSPRVMAVRTRSSQERELKESALEELEAERAKRMELEGQLAAMQQLIAQAGGLPAPAAAAAQTPPRQQTGSRKVERRGSATSVGSADSGTDEARQRQRHNSASLARRGSFERSPEEEVDKPWRAAEGDWLASLRQHEPITNLRRPPPPEISAEQAGLLDGTTAARQRRGSRGGGGGGGGAAGSARGRRASGGGSTAASASTASEVARRRRLYTGGDSVAGGGGGGGGESSSAGFRRMVNLPVEEMMAIRERMGKLERTLSRLHGVDANGWDGTLAQAEKRLRAAAERVIAAAERAGDSEIGSASAAAAGNEQVKAEVEFDAWSKVITAHPAYIRYVQKDFVCVWGRCF